MTDSISYEEFSKRLGSSNAEEDDRVRIDGHEVIKKDLLLRLGVFSDYEGNQVEAWTVICSDWERFEIQSNSIAGEFSLKAEHPLLWEYLLPRTELYFSGSCNSLGVLVSELYDRHVEMTEDWIPFSHFMNDEKPSRLLQNSMGKLAAGPKLLLEQYAKILEKNGISSSFLWERNPKRWDEVSGWVDGYTDLKLLIVDESFVIARDFKFSKAN